MKSISDDDLCSSCIHLQYCPGDESDCNIADPEWPSVCNEDGYSISCHSFIEITNRGDNLI